MVITGYLLYAPNGKKGARMKRMLAGSSFFSIAFLVLGIFLSCAVVDHAIADEGNVTTSEKAVAVSPAAPSPQTAAPAAAAAEPQAVDETEDQVEDEGEEAAEAVPIAPLPAETIDFRDNAPVERRADIQPVLKKIDINRIGAEPYYETFEGQRLGPYFPAKYFMVAQRVEIYQEPKPIDAYIMDAKKIRWLHSAQPWNEDCDYRSQLVPIFTRAYGTEITMCDPKNKEGQLRYTHDYRDIYNGQFPIYLEEHTRDVNYKHEQWDQNEILWMYSKKIPGIEWNFTANAGYRYSTMNAKNDGSTFAYYENRHTYLASASIAPTDRIEAFGQFEYFKSHRPHSTFTYNPDHYFYAGELRMKSKDFKTLVVPRLSYSIDKYYPFYNRFKKWEMQLRVGRDFTKKFSATTTARYVLGIREDVDNTAPTYASPNPINEMAAWTGIENRAQYNIYDKLWVQGGVDFSAGCNMSDFDNLGYLAGLEYYAPGLIRVDFGWRGNQYYNVDDFMSSVYFKVYFFM